MRHFRRHADGLAKGWVGVDGLTDVDGVGAHFDGQSNLANHVACVGTDNTAAQNLAVAMGFGRIVKPAWLHLRRGHWRWRARRLPRGTDPS